MDLISSEEAAKILGVTKSHLHYMTRDGYLRSHLVGQAYQYDPSEVYKLKELRETDITLVEIAARASRAEMIAYRLERQVSRLLNIIGADIPSVDLRKEAVVALHLKVEDACESPVVPSIEDLLEWAQTFQSFNEQYFHEVEREFLTDEPWKPYIKLSNKLAKSMPHEKLRKDLELSTAYNYLEMSRKNLRQVIFCYVRTTSNKRIAYRVIPEAANDFHEDVLSLLSVIVD